jgi:hypothetical protein
MRLTDALAIYAAGLSTTIAVWNYIRAQPQMRVILIFALDKVEGETLSGLGISIQNVSSQPIHIANVSFFYPFRKYTFWDSLETLLRFKRIPRNTGWCSSSLSLHGIEDRCPVSIESGKAHYTFVRQEVIDELLEHAMSRRIRAVVQDALWRNTYSRVFKYPSNRTQP